MVDLTKDDLTQAAQIEHILDNKIEEKYPEAIRVVNLPDLKEKVKYFLEKKYKDGGWRLIFYHDLGDMSLCAEID